MSKALEKELHQINNLDILANDFLYNNGIIFTYREDGNYNDMIMRVLNKIIEVVDSVSKYSQQD